MPILFFFLCNLCILNTALFEFCFCWYMGQSRGGEVGVCLGVGVGGGRGVLVLVVNCCVMLVGMVLFLLCEM